MAKNIRGEDFFLQTLTWYSWERHIDLFGNVFDFGGGCVAARYHSLSSTWKLQITFLTSSCEEVLLTAEMNPRCRLLPRWGGARSIYGNKSY